MFFTPDLLKTLPSSAAATDAGAMITTFQWLLVLGFPVETAAAKAMPQLFSDTAAGPFMAGQPVGA